MEAILKKILASLYLDGREICKRVYHLNNAKELLDEGKSQDGLPPEVYIDRFLKYNADFNEFIDVDQNTHINDLDKCQLFFRSGSGLAEIVNVSVSGLAEEEIELICSVRLYDKKALNTIWLNSCF